MKEYTFDPNSNFTEEDKKRILAIKRAFDSVDLNFEFAGMKIKINPSTYSTFEIATKEKYEDVLKRVVKKVIKNANNIDDVIKNLFILSGEEYETVSKDDYASAIGSLIDIIMFSYTGEMIEL